MGELAHHARLALEPRLELAVAANEACKNLIATIFPTGTRSGWDTDPSSATP
jgi:hypothetical protein